MFSRRQEDAGGVNLPARILIDSGSASTNIVGGNIALDFQTGLFKQTVTITNNNPGALPAFRVLVGGLPEGVTVANAQGEILGNSFLLLNQALEIGESIELTVEYLQGDASGGFEPTFEIELLDAVADQIAGEGVEVDRCEVLGNGDILIEFTSQIGASYTVQYSANGETWTKVVPDITAGGTRQQWIDNGPPKTVSHPSGEKLRLYRVIKRDADQ
ncbi:discoidin domain-containing protein [Akkermansiaceae bacterium]|nr:discoidin domain-containing protein [Akkermansiaceae bacterium]